MESVEKAPMLKGSARMMRKQVKNRAVHYANELQTRSLWGTKTLALLVLFLSIFIHIKAGRRWTRFPRIVLHSRRLVSLGASG